MSPRAFVTLTLAVLALAPAATTATADAPESMSVTGHVRVNDAAAPTGAPVEARLTDGTVLARVNATTDGAFALMVPADDAGTSAREGAADGEVVTFRVLGGPATSNASVTFEASASRAVTLAARLPDLVITLSAPQPATPRAGGTVTLTGSVRNAGPVPADAVSLRVTDAGHAVAGRSLGDVAPGSTRAFAFTVPAGNVSGPRAFIVDASALNGDARPASNAASVRVNVTGNEAPVVTAFTRAPVSPAEGDAVRLSLTAEDADGIASVTFHWVEPLGVGKRTSSRTIREPPFAVTLGPLAYGSNGDAVTYWARVVDASADARATTTTQQSFVVRSPDADAEEAPREDEAADAPPEQPPAGKRPWWGVPGPGAGAALASAAVAAHALGRRSA